MAITLTHASVHENDDGSWKIKIKGDAPETDISNGDGSCTVVVKSPAGTTAGAEAIVIPVDEGADA